MTQAWAVMLLGRRLPEIDLWDEPADLYLVPAMDLPWEEDGTRLFGSDLARRQFMDVAIGELERRLSALGREGPIGVPWEQLREELDGPPG